MRLTALCIAAMITAGCAELRWHKDGADAATLERDLAECRREAHVQADRQTAPSAPGPRIVGVDALGRPIIATPEQHERERFMAEHDLTRYCMGKRGYKLVPVQNP